MNAHAVHTCGNCHGVGHNARTCTARRYVWSDCEINLDGKLFALSDVTALEYPPGLEPDAPLDHIVDALMRARGYGGLATILAQETDLDAWADRLYDLSELTDSEEVFQLCALAMRDPAHFGRLNTWAAKQLRRDQALADCRPVEMLLDRLTRIKE